jgi:hypothetical protein
MLDGRQAQRRRIEARGAVGLLANRALHLQLDQAVISTAYAVGRRRDRGVLPVWPRLRACLVDLG